MTRGWRTTEFWAVVAASIGAVAAALADALPPRWAAVVVAVSTGAYAISRGLSKVTPPK